MKIALMMENSKASKDAIILTKLAPSLMRRDFSSLTSACAMKMIILRTSIQALWRVFCLIKKLLILWLLAAAPVGRAHIAEYSSWRYLRLLHRSDRCFPVCLDQQWKCVVPAICERLWLGHRDERAFHF